MRRYRFTPPRRGLAMQTQRLTRALGGGGRDTMAVRPVDLTRRGYRGATGTGGVTERGGAGEAWALYRSGTVPELKYLVSHLGNALSMCRLVASDIDPDTGQATGTIDTTTRWGKLAAEVALDIAGGPAGQSQLLRRAAANLTVTGRFHLAIVHERGIRPGGDPVAQRWLVLSDAEVAEDTDGGKRIMLPEGGWYRLDPAADSLHTVWQPHAEIASQSDSLVLGSLDLLLEISLYGQVINARSRNALLSNGLVRLPSALQVSVPDMHPDAAGNDVLGGPSMSTVDATPNTLAQLIMAQAMAAADDPASLEATMPVFVQGGESGDERNSPIEVVSLSPAGTEDYAARRREAITRWVGITDIPREAIEGYGSSNRWNAWYTGEQFITMHVRPIGTTIADGLTDGVYRAALRALGHPDPESVTLWPDTTTLAVKPDRSEAADEAVAVGAIGLAAFRHAKGFADEDGFDLTTDEGRRDWAAWLVAKNETTLSDPLVAQWLGLPGPITITGRTISDPGSTTNTDAPADRVRGVPNTQDDAATGAAIRQIRRA